MIKAQKNDIVTVRYTGRLPDGTVIDQTTDDRPLKFIIGKSEVIPGFDEAVEGMFKGESKQCTIPFAKAYGPPNPDLTETIRISDLPDDLLLQKGGQLEITRADGSLLRVTITDLTETHVTLDANHPLAGHDLVFDIDLIDVSKQPAR